MRHEGPMLSVRHDAAGSMAGAIFMSNTITREQCFQASIFGLPSEYQSFVSHVRKGMPLFLFDHNLRKLYGVFEAASDGGFNINSAAFRSIHRSYPAQVRINIIWKCKPLGEDEFFPAIEDNYYKPRKFYFDLSCEQVVRLYELFDEKRVERPIHEYPQNECLQTICSIKGMSDKENLTPEVIRCSTPTRMHTDSMIDDVSTKVSAPCSETTRQYQLVGKSHPLPQNYSQNILPPGFTAQDPIEGSKFVENQPYTLCCGYLHNGLFTSGYGTSKGMNHLNSTFPPYDHLSPCLPASNPQSNSDYQGQCDICFNQGRPDTHNDIYAYERQCLSEGEMLTTEKLNQQGKHGTHGNASDLSDLENGIVVPRYTRHAIGAENNTKDQCSLPIKGVFSRLSVRKEPTSQVAPGPTLNQLVSSLSRKTEQWRHKNKTFEDGLVIPLIGEQAVDCSHAPLNLSNQLDLEEDVSIEPQLPFLNFKRRSEAGKVDANLRKEISGKVKRRKLVRPSFEENNACTNVGKQLKGNCTQDRNQSNQGNENHFDIDLNIPAEPIDNNPVEVNRIAVCPSVIDKVQTEKPYELDTNKANSSNVETTEEHDPSSAPAQKVNTDFNIADLNTMDELKLRTVLDHTSSLLQALATLKNGESDKAMSGICLEDTKVNMPLNSDGGNQT